jgi:ketosteroid isomerase-like protein
MNAGAPPAVAVTISFIDCINRGDLQGLSRLMSPDHRLEIFDETPLIGRQAVTEAWQGYFEGFPHYVIYPRRITELGETVAVLGHTTGSHLGLPDSQERQVTLIWLANIAHGTVTRWRLVEDNDAHRRAFHLDERP